MKKKKLKLKKQVIYIIIFILIVTISAIGGNYLYKDYKYKQTTKYKLLNIGYSSKEYDILKNSLSNDYLEKLTAQEKNSTLLNILQEKYYLKRNLDRYLSLAEKSPDKSTTEIISIVNTNSDYERYEHDIESDISLDYLLIVNKYYYLNGDYAPSDLVKVNSKYYYGSGHTIRKTVYDAFIDMWNAANKENIYLIINSGYRAYEDQKRIYNEYVEDFGSTYAEETAARPGYSEHQTGLALDIFSKDSTTTSSFKNSKAYTWLLDNAYKYGFIQRYPKEFENLTGYAEETWHWRYVGIEAATYIHENNITFDEYYAYFLEK